MNVKISSKGMASRLVLACFIITLCIYPGVAATTTSETSTADTSTAGEQIAVSNITIDPEILMPGDTATLVVRVTNNGQESVTINRAEILSNEIKVLNYQTYVKIGTLGPGISREFTFIISTNAKDGTYFPVFYMDFQNAGSLKYPIPVRVDTTGIGVSVIDAPESFAQDQKNDVALVISNPRDSDITGVTITAGGEGITSTKTAAFLGTIRPDETKNVTFTIIPDQATDLIFNVTYRNSVNNHFTTLSMPIKVGGRSVQAELVVNGIEITSTGGTYTAKGDVTNSGLEDARSILVTVGSPAQAVNPNKVYVIGSLEPDDFSTFEVTFTAQGASMIPLTIQYKDDDGTTYTTTEQITLGQMGSSASINAAASGGQQSAVGPGQGGMGRSAGGMGFFGMSGGGLNSLPTVPIIIVLATGVALVVLWRKGVLGKVRTRLRKR